VALLVLVGCRIIGERLVFGQCRLAVQGEIDAVVLAGEDIAQHLHLVAFGNQVVLKEPGEPPRRLPVEPVDEKDLALRTEEQPGPPGQQLAGRWRVARADGYFQGEFFHAIMIDGLVKSLYFTTEHMEITENIFFCSSSALWALW
jgi:hypothetical protein